MSNFEEFLIEFEKYLERNFGISKNMKLITIFYMILKKR